MLDRIRKDIEERLKQLLAEADKLRHALEALDPREKPAPRPTGQSPATTPTRKPRAATPRKRSTAQEKQAGSTPGQAPRRRTAQGGTKAKVLAALSTDAGMTASEVAKATGLGQGSVSTTLSKLAKTGEITKAKRGYQLPTATESAPITTESTES